ncbi:unnamed protein product [Thelazia callipaeda]|uniref:Uncharacterized protein n=1 Tax=Thelazia callipaeda TaxID=103827 RepID=A0A0N5CRQ8_THECL|nr:unnamed protein product [Thelazia callipaeda]
MASTTTVSSLLLIFLAVVTVQVMPEVQSSDFDYTSILQNEAEKHSSNAGRIGFRPRKRDFINKSFAPFMENAMAREIRSLALGRPNFRPAKRSSYTLNEFDSWLAEQIPSNANPTPENIKK